MNDSEIMQKCRLKWVREHANTSKPMPSEQALAGYYRGFIDALSVALNRTIDEAQRAEGVAKFSLDPDAVRVATGDLDALDADEVLDDAKIMAIEIVRLALGQARQEQCLYCKEWYPFPVGLHHTEQECDASLAGPSDSHK